MIRKRSLFISLPWADYQGPSLQIGCLSSFLRSKGFDAEARHLHLAAAADFGLKDYNKFTRATWMPTRDAICAALLFPSSEKRLLRYIRKWVPQVDSYARRLRKIFRKIYDGIDWKEYDLVGFTVNFDQLFSSLLLASWIKKDHPQIFIVLGGRSVAKKMGESIIEKFPQIDWCIDGEGEEAILKLLEGLADSRLRFESSVPGLIYRDGKRVIRNSRKLLASLSGLPDPDFDHYFHVLDTHPKLHGLETIPYLPIETTRGCRHRCAFCCDCGYWMSYRERPAREVADSLRRLTDRYKVTSINLIEQLITPEYAASLFPIVASHEADYRIFCEVRADISKEQLRTMKRAGVSTVQIGIEAMNTKLLQKMRKGLRLIDNLKVLKFCEEIGIRHDSNLIYKFPAESQKDVDDSVRAMDYAASYMPPGLLVPFEILEGSPIYQHPKKFGISKIIEAGAFGPLLPPDIRKGLDFWYKEYRSNRKERDYRAFRERWRRWMDDYEESQRIGRGLLYYMDMNDRFLRIEDFREGTRSITLEGLPRDLYLYCDEIRGFDEIRSRFHDEDPKEIRETLRQLHKLKLMYTEGEDWLSLAIHASPENRRHMPFT